MISKENNLKASNGVKKKASFSVVGVIAALALLVGIWFFGFIELRAMARRTAVLGEKKATLEARRGNLQSLEAFIGNIAADQERVANVFVSEQTLVEFIERLERLAGETGVSLAIQEAQLPKKTGEHLSIRFSTAGNLRDTMQYLLLVEHLPYQLRLTNADMQKNNARKGGDDWNAHYQLQVLSFE